MLMTSKDRVLQRERDRGRAAALNLAGRVHEMTGTAIIAEQGHIPAWREDAVYEAKHVGFPLQYEDQVYILTMPHTPAHNPGMFPKDLPAIYSRKNTTDPKLAKDWMAPYGESGKYLKGDCARDGGYVWQSGFDGQNTWRPTEVELTNPGLWIKLGTVEEIQG